MNVAPGPGFSLGTGADRDGGPGECRGAACCAPTMRRRDFLGACGIGLAGIFVRRWPAHGDVLVERWSWAMGQAVHLMVYAESEQSGLDACGAALAELRRVEARLTLFDDASDLCELNRRAGKRAMVVDRDLAAVLALAEGFRRATGGAFNVAVEPLMRGRGIRRAFLDVSGDVAAGRAPPGEAGWLVGIADPDRPGATRATVRLRDAALATAANTVSLVRYGSLVAGHVMDPATGWPARALTQASVVTRAAVAADALSTAMLVSGRAPVDVMRSYAVRG